MDVRISISLVALLMIVALLGCGGDRSDNNHGLGFSFDAELNGLRVSYADGGPHEPAIDTLWGYFTDTIACADSIGPPERAGLPVSQPLVIIVQMGTNDPLDGRTFFDTGTITIERQWAHDRGLFIEEFVHWILHSRGLPLEDNKLHIAPEFECKWLQ